MAKCVACTALNMGIEANKHPNATTVITAELLRDRWNDVSKRETSRYCVLHSTTGTGRATGEFIKPAADKLAAMKSAAELA
jgi:hypothetical protein